MRFPSCLLAILQAVHDVFAREHPRRFLEGRSRAAPVTNMEDRRSSDGTPHGRRNAGAFLGPSGTFPADIHTLSDEIPRDPSELEAERRGPVRAPARVDHLRDRIRRLFVWKRR
jgi:hypothetical protein